MICQMVRCGGTLTTNVIQGCKWKEGVIPLFFILRTHSAPLPRSRGVFLLYRGRKEPNANKEKKELFENQINAFLWDLFCK